MVKTMSTLASIFDAGQMQTVLELGLITSLTVLALFLSYTMLNVCDLSTDGCFTLGAAVGAIVALNGHPILSIPLAMLAGVVSGLITALLQTVLGIDSLLAGIVVNTGLYSINIAVMKKSSLLNLNSADTVFSLLKSKLDGTALEGKQTLIIAALAVFLIVLFLSLFLKTKLGLSIRATGNNPDMVKSSSINPIVTTIIGLCIANSFTALSGCLLAQSQKQAEINIGTGMVTVALASLLIGGVFVRRGKIPLRAIGAVIGAVVFRLVYQIAIGLHMPPFMLKFVSSVIVIIAIAGPYLKTKMPEYIRKAKLRSGKKVQ